MLLYAFPKFPNGLGHHDVIRIKPDDPIARRPPNAFVDGRTLPPVFLTLPIGDDVLKFVNHLNGIVCRPTIHNENLQILVILLFQRPQGPFYKTPLIIGGNDNGNLHGIWHGKLGGVKAR